jgi:ribosome-binding factor A
VSHRRARVAQELREELAGLIQREVRDPRLEFVTIIDVELSPDYSFARVFWRGVGNPEDAERALDHARPYLRRLLASRVRLRRVPELDFRRDTSLERGARVEAILAELEAERRARATPPPDEAKDGPGMNDEKARGAPGMRGRAARGARAARSQED